ncbi:MULTISPECIES: hypothetical protein [Rhodococcus]|jgi:hypothetical protein|uniref:Uncharacterized protein n=1 Tax=Rhodococcus jostii (strain RHA1) TaxID=101510 RepID=Q0SG76_RHOJR|nr:MULTISPECIES: hypothetical protein [Rhodococcus]ABG93460.1 conserved hypothetical protein [Rhodococcus jostii RHA1]
MSTPRRRPLKTVTGVSGAVSTYAAAIDPQQSTVASSIEIAKIAEANKFDAPRDHHVPPPFTLSVV